MPTDAALRSDAPSLEVTRSWWVEAQQGPRAAFFAAAIARRAARARELKPGPAAHPPWPWSKRTVARVTAVAEGSR